jgi:LPXTG-motif cell wall-anchored protein
MNTIRIATIALIVAGVLGLVYGGISYTTETHGAKLGPIELKVTEKERINVPTWAGLAGILIGGALLLFARKKG